MNKEEATKAAQAFFGKKSKVKYATVEMVVHRAATNTDEDYGVISAYHKNPIIHLLMQIDIKLRGYKRQWPR